MSKKILVTGSAGFIGFHTTMSLAAEGYEVVGLDNINDYYSPELKYSRLRESGIASEDVRWHTLAISAKFPNYRFVRMSLEDKQQLFSLFHAEQFDYVINLAAQAGVRYSIENPDVYVQTNVFGFFHILEACRHYKVKHLVHASSSSVYGMNAKIPYSEDDKCDSPVSLYAATKKSNELMAHAYSHLYGIQCTCLRFFTVYGPYGRPDMAPMLFANAICKGKPISVFNNGELERDFTFISDIVEGVMQATFNFRNKDSKFSVLNIGNGAPVNLTDFISMLEKKLNKEAIKKYLPMQPGDVYRTWADQAKLMSGTGYRPSTSLECGVEQFVNWFTEYYKCV